MRDLAAGGYHDRACPCCDGAAYRVPRRFIDVLLGVFGHTHRYRCATMGCNWEGNLRVYPVVSLPR
ncbi:hypothetical protein [Zoogloea sp.]|uniref:hypothetical protein n=1 Tax=Zoogloea sp. TaxID=49181 RepID=UPI0014166263|nr:MAG: hypothetical protein F9K15_02255 [Zoogloea sp.]